MSVRGGRSGAGPRGGPSAKDSVSDAIGGDWQYFAGATTRRLWGVNSLKSVHAQINGVVTGAGGADRLRAYPHVFPRGGTIGRIGWFQGPAAIEANNYSLSMGIYSNSNGDIAAEPFERLSHATFTTWPTGGGGANADSWRSWTANLPVAPMTVLWLVWYYNTNLQNNATGQTMQRIQAIEGDCQIVLGIQDPEIIHPGDTQYRMPSVQSNQYGWQVVRAYDGSVPLTWPGSPARLCGDAVGSNPANDVNAQWSGRMPVILWEWTPD